MANKYSKANTKKSGAEDAKMREFDENRRRLNKGARIMAIVVSIAMIVTAFLSAGVFFLR